jgi:imidazoleglycerol-phosphate dehydratase
MTATVTQQRRATLERKTKETHVRLSVDLDDPSTVRIETPVGFLSHMLEAVARHAAIGLVVEATGDTHIDYHHTVEDVGLLFGDAVKEALGDKSGIRRFGHAYVPLDEALARVVIDFSGRPFFVFEAELDTEMLLVHKDFPFALVEEFLKSFAFRCGCNLHVDLIRGRNGHHAAEAIFKALAVSLRMAKERIGGSIPSTKGVL